ncbi:helix-turn-helix transcriptional regulator [Acrocarpospora sp. B8E8]|uniref:helix-turn-helix domain-containing protein n=1 Tax=Acrocarpospora sp. B8E8 TaxID=3153572 RepID=UPI00325D4410
MTATTDNVPAEPPRAQPLHVRLRQAREQAGLTQEQAGEKFGCAASGIHQIEIGTIRLLPRRLDDLLALYGLRVELVPVEDVTR